MISSAGLPAARGGVAAVLRPAMVPAARGGVAAVLRPAMVPAARGGVAAVLRPAMVPAVVVAAVAAAACVVAMVAAAVAADRLLAAAAARRIAVRIGLASRAASPPEVRFLGGSFLTQFVAGRYREVEIVLAGFTAVGVEFAGLTARLTGVRAPRSMLRSGGATAGQVAATITVSLAVVAGRLPPGLALRRRGGDLAVVGSALPGPVSGLLRITADAQRITVTPAIFGIPGLIGFEVALPPLPAGLTVASVTVGDGGVEISLEGSEIALSGAVLAGAAQDDPACAEPQSPRPR